MVEIQIDNQKIEADEGKTILEVARENGIGSDFRLVMNNGAVAGQTVFHLHLHILGGRAMNWPPG